MRVVLLTAFLCAPLIAQASDKDTLREACSSLKNSAKRSQCFDALERLSLAQSPSPATSAAPKELKANLRGLECERFEFAEIDSLPRDELEALYCSYSLGAKISEKTTKDAEVKHEGHPKVLVALLSRHVSILDRCLGGMAKTRETFTRKFKGEKIDCSKLSVRSEQAGLVPAPSSH